MANLSKSIKNIFHPGANKNKNPYAANNDGGNPTQPTLRPVSPREPYDFLGEARQSAGRDRITGKRVDHFPHQSPVLAARSESAVQGGSSSSGAVAVAAAEGGRGERSNEQSAYTKTIQSRSRTSGSRYDLFVQEMKAKKASAVQPGRDGYYAPPPKMLTEYYAPAANFR